MEITERARMTAHTILTNRTSGIQTMFDASREAVADVKPGKVSRAAFDKSLKAAAKAINKSIIPFAYDNMRVEIESVPRRLVWMAARQAAGDAFAARKSKADNRLLKRMNEAATEAAKAGLEGDAMEAAGKAARRISKRASNLTSNIVMTAAPVHAAAVALFEVGVRGATSKTLQDEVKAACKKMPEAARRYKDIGAPMMAAFAEAILQIAPGRRKYQTAVQAVEEMCRNEAVERIIGMIDENTFEAAYGALAGCAHAASNGRVFESGYEGALAAACGMDTSVQVPGDIAPDEINKVLKNLPPEVADRVSESDIRAMYLRLQNRMAWMLNPEDVDKQKRLNMALGVNYREAAADPDVADLISLYKAAYEVAHEAAAKVR